MPEPVSALGLCCIAGYTALSTYARGGSAISSEARAARDAAIKIVASVERSQVLFGEKNIAISQIWGLVISCGDAGWDGEGSEAISVTAATIAENFVRALPDGFPMPEFAPEPDGSISLDWIESGTRMFSISAGTNNRLAYAWIDGSDRGHAVDRFDDETVPARILFGIREIMNHGDASFRAA